VVDTVLLSLCERIVRGNVAVLAAHRRGHLAADFAADNVAAGGVVIDKLDVAFFNRKPSAGQALVFFMAIAVDDFVLLLNELAEISEALWLVFNAPSTVYPGTESTTSEAAPQTGEV